MTIDADSIRNNLPHYLTSEDKEALVGELRSIAGGGNASYILGGYDDVFREDILQGDGWRRLDLFEFESGKRLEVHGLILSNSCDIDPNNNRQIPPRIVFAPLVKLSALRAVMEQGKVDRQKIEDQLAAMRAQKITSVFYLPSGGQLEDEYVVRLDNVHSIPLSYYLGKKDKAKSFTLSMTGFYMLVFKLSVHFCRLQENVVRGARVN